MSEIPFPLPDNFPALPVGHQRLFASLAVQANDLA
jgi:hypothetical protein